MSKYKVTRWMQASVPVVSYVEANSSEEAEEESSTAPYNYDYGNAVIGDIEDTEVEEVVEEDSGQDIESDIYAQDTWKNDWRKSEEIVNKYFDGNEDYLEAIMDNVTSDSYKDETGDDYFWNKHAKIITDNFYGDWNWLEAIQYWDEKDIAKAKSIYSNDFQQTHNLKPGNSTFDNRRRTTESKDVQRLKDLIKYRS